MTKMGAFEIGHIDEFVDMLLNEDRGCEIILPRLQKVEFETKLILF